MLSTQLPIPCTFQLVPSFSLEPCKYLPRPGTGSSSHCSLSVTHVRHLSSASFGICGWMLLVVLKGCVLFPWTFYLPVVFPFSLMPFYRGMGVQLVGLGHFVGREGDKTSFIHTACFSVCYRLRKSECYLRPNFVVAIRC